MNYDLEIKISDFKNGFGKAAKNRIDDKLYILDYCLTKRAWKDAVIREKFDPSSTILANKTTIINILKNELTSNVNEICNDFNNWHNKMCSITDYKMRYGVWQKFINMTFKNLYCVNDLFPEFKEIWSKCHCPVDTKIAKNLNTALKGLNLPVDELKLSYLISKSQQITWNNISRENYLEFQRQVNLVCGQENTSPLEFDFIRWKP